MQKILFTLLFSILLFPSLSGQDIYQIKAFADAQYEAKNYDLALKEYQRVFIFDTKQEFNDIFTKIADVFFKNKAYYDAIKYYNLAWKTEKNDSIKNELVFNKVLCNLNNGNYLGGLNELYDLPEINSKYFLNKQKLYEGICHFGLDEYDKSLKLFSEIVGNDASIPLNEIFDNLKKFNKKFAPHRIETMSRILPGLGQVYVGEWASGINSLLLLGAIAYYSGYTMVFYSVLDGILVLTSWFNRYYDGGAEKAKHLAEEKIEVNKSEVYLKILQIIEKQEIKNIRY
jgi:tetratricopeptide (TPR) repeat protein